MTIAVDELVKKLDSEYWSKQAIQQKLGHLQVAQSIMAKLSPADLLSLVQEIASSDDVAELDIEDPLPSHCDFVSRLQALCTEFVVTIFLTDSQDEVFDEDERRRKV